jgi:purine-binding chemotaxis protein CheW
MKEQRMAMASAAALASRVTPSAEAVTTDYVTFTVAGQLFGIPVLKVQDILVPDKIAHVPLAPPEVRGSINLRGRIVTVIDVRTRLGLPLKDGETVRHMGVTVENGQDLYTLLVDNVGDVISLSHELYEPNPSTLDQSWMEFADGVFRLEGSLMVVLNTARLLDLRNRIESMAQNHG